MFSSMMIYGAVATKVRAMYGKRVRPEDYNRLIGLKSTAQVADYLKKHVGWSELLGNVDVSDIHRLRLEAEIEAALYIEYQKIESFIPFGARALTRYPIIQAEIMQILSVIRNLSAGTSEKNHYELPRSVKYKTEIDIGTLTMAQNYAQMLEALRNTDYHGILQRFQPQGDENVDYPAIELALDAYFFNRMFTLANKGFTGETLRMLKNMIGERIDVINITRTLRLRRYFPDSANELSLYLIPVYYKIKTDFLYDLAKMSDESAVLVALRATPYGKYFNSTDFKYIESYHDRYLTSFYTRLIHASSPNLLIPLAYLNYKQLEIRNLIHIVECVHYGAPPESVLPYITEVLSMTPERR